MTYDKTSRQSEGRHFFVVILCICLVLANGIFDCGVANAATERGKVKAIKYVYPATDSVTYEENTNGRWRLDENGELYYAYRAPYAEPEMFTVEYENGEEITYSNVGVEGDPYWSHCSYNGNDGTTLELYSPMRSNQEENHFTVGGNNYFTFQFGGASVQIPVKITASQTENTIKSIKYEPVVNETDYSRCSSVYNAEKDMEQLFFWQDYFYNKGDKLTVENKDGGNKTYTYEPGRIITEGDNEIWVDSRFVADDGSEISPDDLGIYDDQDLYEWGYDKDCYYLVEYGGAVTKVPITVAENDVLSISLYVEEDSEGLPTLSCDEEGNRERLIDGITVHKRDGSTETIKYQSKWIGDEEGNGYYEEGFFDEEGNIIEDLQIRHLKLKESGQWYVFYHGVSCPIETSHWPIIWNVKEKPTCNKSGAYEGKCKNCGEVQGTKEISIEPTAHMFSNYVYNNDAKVGVDGTETATCDNGCGTKDTRTKAGTALSSSGGGGGGGFIPPVQPEKPTISTGEGYNVTLASDGKTATIAVEDGYELVGVTVNGASKGIVTSLSDLKTGDKVEIKVSKKAEVTEIDKIKAELKKVNAGNFKARSKQVKLKNGKKAIKITLTNTSGVKFDGIEVFRSTKRYKGYGKKPIFTTKTNKYYNTSIKKGTKYYYRARGYVVIDGVKYYSGWSKKAWRTVK